MVITFGDCLANGVSPVLIAVKITLLKRRFTLVSGAGFSDGAWIRCHGHSIASSTQEQFASVCQFAWLL
jgi:heme A synthase